MMTNDSPQVTLSSRPEQTHTPYVSVVIPCRNEEQFIAQCLDSIVASQFPQDQLEILVVDGMSDDGTRAVLKVYTDRYPYIRVLDNPRRITPVAFNIGIQHAHGQLIMIMSAHATMAKDAIAKCVEYSARYQADNVGGSWKIVPRDDSFVARAITAVLSNSFGVGNARYRTRGSSEPMWVDTAAYGCYRREVFQRVGLFNEQLVRSQDMEFNLRLKKAGGQTLLVPDIVIYYYARSDFRSFSRHNFSNGFWAIVPFQYSEIMPVSWRHLVPMVFVAGLLGSASLAAASILPWLPFTVIVGAYGVASLTAAARVACREGDVRFGVLLPFLFGSLHLTYGLGSLWGVVKVGLGLLAGRGRRAHLQQTR